jgi:putative endonuclease
VTASRRLGDEGERRAALALEAAGYEVVARNARVGHDELDIIARDGDMWAFVEVKTRRSDAYGAPDEAVTPAKRQKLLRAARAWLLARGEQDPSWRFDVVTVRFQDGAPPRIEIIRNAFGD